jgi:nicotinamide-nucleotide amidase
LARGIETIEHATVRDNRAATAAAIRRLAGAAPLVIVTGGLGPTADDLTRHALADALGEHLVTDPRRDGPWATDVDEWEARIAKDRGQDGA